VLVVSAADVSAADVFVDGLVGVGRALGVPLAGETEQSFTSTSHLRQLLSN
jgi:hypothetical protein